MSVRTDPRKPVAGNAPGPGSQAHLDTVATISAAQDADGAHNEAADFNTATAENPLSRTVSVSFRASMNDLCLRKQRSTWAPTTEALQSIFRQKRFTNLQGASELSGDLKSVVLHQISLESVSSTFPVSVGTQVTAVDNSTFSITGASFANIVAPNASSNTAVTLQKDDVSLAYEASVADSTPLVAAQPLGSAPSSSSDSAPACWQFARKFPVRSLQVLSSLPTLAAFSGVTLEPLACCFDMPVFPPCLQGYTSDSSWANSNSSALYSQLWIA